MSSIWPFLILQNSKSSWKKKKKEIVFKETTAKDWLTDCTSTYSSAGKMYMYCTMYIFRQSVSSLFVWGKNRVAFGIPLFNFRSILVIFTLFTPYHTSKPLDLFPLFFETMFLLLVSILFTRVFSYSNGAPICSTTDLSAIYGMSNADRDATNAAGWAVTTSPTTGIAPGKALMGH